MHHSFSKLILAMIGVGVLLLIACSPSSERTTDSTASKGPYGELNIGVDKLGGFISSTSPDFMQGQTFQQITAPMFDSVVELTSEGTARPGLAERWELSPDGMTHTFYIRKGVKFHNGDDLTGEDVKFTLEKMLNPKHVGVGCDVPFWIDAVANIEVKEGYIVVVHMKRPQFELLSGLEYLQGCGAVMPKKYIEEKGFDYFAKALVGSGPWKFVSWIPDSVLKLEAVESHWRKVPEFKNITLVRIADEGAKVAQIKTGELDMAIISPESAPALKAAGRRIIAHYGGSQYFLNLFFDAFNPEKYHLGDLRVRKALSLAINRQELADKMYFGYAQPSAIAFAPRTAFFYDPNVLKPDPFDPEQAKRLLVEAGYPNGFDMTYWSIQMAGTIQAVLDEAVSGYWRKVGVRAQLVPTISTTMSPPRPELYDTVYTLWSTGGVFGFQRFFRFYDSKRSSRGNINVPRIDELIVKVPLTRDPAEKKKLALEAAELGMNYRSTISILDMDALFYVGPKVQDMMLIKNVAGLGASLETITHAK